MALREDAAAACRSSRRKPHFVLVPLMAQGHIIPMVDMAHLLAIHGAAVTFITTPVNAARIKPAIDRAKQSGLPIRFVELPFPCSDAGLPDGCENFDLVPSPDLFRPFFNAIALLRDPLLLHLREQQQPATCIISDYCTPWTMEVARELHIPRIIFHGPPCFFLLCIRNIHLHGLYGGGAAADDELFLVPDLPHHQVEVTLLQAPQPLNVPGWEDIRDQALEAEATAEGVVVNTFDALESPFLEIFKKSIGKGVWAIGPLSLYHKDDDAGTAARGGTPDVDEKLVTSWLDSMEPKSVVYASFGSLTHSSYSQLVNIGLGLEAAGKPFIWVLKGLAKLPEFERWLSDGGGLEERTKGRGMIVRGWAPQLVILNHEAVGGFLTHCGWNSMLEAVAAGVPVATWPHFYDQFLNEKLLVEVLGIGVAVGVKKPVTHVMNEEVVLVNDVKIAIDRLMDGGKEAEERRERARELSEQARMAMQEGGSSYESLKLLIQEYVNKEEEEL